MPTRTVWVLRQPDSRANCWRQFEGAVREPPVLPSRSYPVSRSSSRPIPAPLLFYFPHSPGNGEPEGAGTWDTSGPSPNVGIGKKPNPDRCAPAAYADKRSTGRLASLSEEIEDIESGSNYTVVSFRSSALSNTAPRSYRRPKTDNSSGASSSSLFASGLVSSPQIAHPVVRLARRFGNAKPIQALGHDAHGRLQ